MNYMGHKPNPNRSIPTATNSLQDECIRVQKVYDWVTDQLMVSKNIEFSDDQLEQIECAMEDPSRRPLRIVAQTPEAPPLFPLSDSDHCEEFLCEQVGEKRDVNVVLPGGGYADAQLVDLLFTSDVKVKVVDRHGQTVTEVNCNASVLESFVLCYPDGTDLYCRITKIIARIPSGTILLNCPVPQSFDLEVIFCVDIQVEAEVKLEVLAKFCSPRDNDLIAPEDVDEWCPPVTFPEQCPDIFPRPSCDCTVAGEASGSTGNPEYEGNISMKLNICPDCSMTGSNMSFTFNDSNMEDGTMDFSFTAESFDQDSLVCVPCGDDGVKFMINGSGRMKNGIRCEFKLAVVDTEEGNDFEVHLYDRRGDTVFNSGVVEAETGALTIDNCINFDDIKYKKHH